MMQNETDAEPTVTAMKAINTGSYLKMKVIYLKTSQ